MQSKSNEKLNGKQSHSNSMLAVVLLHRCFNDYITL